MGVSLPSRETVQTAVFRGPFDDDDVAIEPGSVPVTPAINAALFPEAVNVDERRREQSTHLLLGSLGVVWVLTWPD